MKSCEYSGDCFNSVDRCLLYKTSGIKEYYCKKHAAQRQQNLSINNIKTRMINLNKARI